MSCGVATRGDKSNSGNTIVNPFFPSFQLRGVSTVLARPLLYWPLVNCPLSSQS